MIKSAKYNGINFSSDFTRVSKLYNFDNQRVKNDLPCDLKLEYLSFFYDGVNSPTNVVLTAHDKAGAHVITTVAPSSIPGGWIIYASIPSGALTNGLDVHFSLKIETDTIYSEIYSVKTFAAMQAAGYCLVSGKNADSRHGYLTNQAFGLFKLSKLKSDIFLNKKVEYEYSYSRKKLLSSENQIGKRLTFLDLTMNSANLIKWLCNCETLTIESISYQLISDFSESESDPNSEILNLQADFVEVNQSFFANTSSTPPIDIFTKNFFN